MEQSISFKIGKGSIAHNARDFTASNVDSNRSQYNIEYVNKDLKQTYHELFDMPSQNTTLDKLVVIVPFQIIMKK